MVFNRMKNRIIKVFFVVVLCLYLFEFAISPLSEKACIFFVRETMNEAKKGNLDANQVLTLINNFLSLLFSSYQ